MQAWVPAVAAFAAGVLVLKLKDWFKSLVDKVAALLYDRLAGSALLARTALRRYIVRVHERHERFSVSFQIDAPQAMDMSSVYVPLRTASGFGAGAEQSEAAASLHEARRAVVLGVPGAGKTMLLRHTVLAWCRERYRPDGPPRRAWYGRRRPPKAEPGELVDVPVLLKLHEVNLEKGDLRDHIVKHFADHDFPGAGKWTDRALAEGRLAVYFDGLDEVPTDRRKEVADAIGQFMRTQAKCRTVVTCRIAVYRGEFNEDADRTLRVQEFDERLVRRFLHGWPWPEHLPPDTVDQLLGALRDTPQLMPLARNPLLLTMIAYLYSNVYAGTDQVLPHTRADFYKQVTDSLLGDRQRDARFSHPVKKAVLQALALAAQDVPSDVHDRLALPEREVLSCVRAALEEQGRPVDRAQEVLEEIVERSGLLLAVDSGERYQFAHLTLQEYLAATRLAADPSGLLARYRRDPATWRETVRLWCGAETRDCTGVVREVFGLDPLLAFQCLADAPVVDDALADEIVGTFRYRLGREMGASRSLVIAAFGVVAADRRARGAAVFDLLSVFAADGGSPGRQAAALAALAATNLPRAAERLAELLPTVPGAGPALVGMGDLAVPALRRAVLNGEPAAARLLWEIRTPRAAVALAAFLPEAVGYGGWGVEHAYLIADLLRDPDIECALRALPQRAFDDGFLWVWRPFAAGDGDPLVERVSRIVRVITAEWASPPPGVEADPRILAALALVGWGPPVSLAASVTDDALAAELGRRAGAVVTSADMASALEAGRPVTLGERYLRLAGLPARQVLMLALLPARLRASAAAVLCRQSAITVDAWERVNEPVEYPDYHLMGGWHSRALLAICFAASGVAAFRAADAAVGWHPWGPGWLGWVVMFAIVGGWGMFLADSEISEAVFTTALVVLVPAVCVYGIVAAHDWWGTATAWGVWAAVVGACVALGARADALDRRAEASRTPLRRFVQNHLNP
ncbi:MULTISPECIES: NACHT domain-containing NTPase [unclassified Streptomyces]|uniref:NACHT domain-containing protein n=1 Tax=Streptomyces sp. NBC_00060 TaxID=2975636 RepID=A0AAU2GVJ5_9ACTN